MMTTIMMMALRLTAVLPRGLLGHGQAEMMTMMKILMTILMIMMMMMIVMIMVRMKRVAW